MFSLQKSLPQSQLSSEFQMMLKVDTFEYVNPTTEVKSTGKAEYIGITVPANFYFVGVAGLRDFLEANQGDVEKILPNTSMGEDKKELGERLALLSISLKIDNPEVTLIRCDKPLSEIIKDNDPKQIYDYIVNANKTFKKTMGNSICIAIKKEVNSTSTLSPLNR